MEIGVQSIHMTGTDTSTRDTDQSVELHRPPRRLDEKADETDKSKILPVTKYMSTFPGPIRTRGCLPSLHPISPRNTNSPFFPASKRLKAARGSEDTILAMMSRRHLPEAPRNPSRHHAPQHLPSIR